MNDSCLYVIHLFYAENLSMKKIMLMHEKNFMLKILCIIVRTGFWIALILNVMATELYDEQIFRVRKIQYILNV